MTRATSLLALGLAALVGAGALVVAEQPAGRVLAREAPQKAKDVLAEIRDRGGAPPPGYVGGRRFQNRERRLPRGIYREYDVDPKIPGRSRGAERIVIEQRTGRAYYSPDHYTTFIPLD